jgi:hypothetical protein
MASGRLRHDHGRGDAPATCPTAAQGVTSYGLFLAGEAALNDGQSGGAGQWFDAALGHPGADPLVGERAFTATRSRSQRE